MSDFGDFENVRSAFLGLERRRDCEGMPYGAFFGEVFAIFGGFFAKSESFFSKIGRNRTVFGTFEKGWVVIALSRGLKQADGPPGQKEPEKGKTLDRINKISKEG